jgi:hypothetical protein
MKYARADTDPQREQDVSQQRGYGETPGRGDETAESGFRGGQATATDDEQGMLRGDGQPRPVGDEGEPIDVQSSPVISPDDERSPNTAAMPDADTGSRKATPGAVKPVPGNTELEDACSKNDPGRDTRD